MIINADDFGYSLDVNKAVIESFEKGYCSSTTIMANMPGFEEACHQVNKRRLQNFTGIHFVLTEGKPMTEGIKGCSLFCSAEGVFNFSRKRRILYLSSHERSLLAEELRAQVRKCRQNGVSLTHADSHRHAHEEWAITHVVIKVCKEEGIRFLRLARNCGSDRKFYKRIYRQFLNCKLKKAGLSRTLYFGSVEDYGYLIAKEGLNDKTCSIEVMIHPGYDEEGMLVDRQSMVPLDEIMNTVKSPFDSESFTGYRWDRR